MAKEVASTSVGGCSIPFIDKDLLLRRVLETFSVKSLLSLLEAPRPTFLPHLDALLGTTGGSTASGPSD